jgi:hypothetical protein
MENLRTENIYKVWQEKAFPKELYPLTESICIEGLTKAGGGEVSICILNLVHRIQFTIFNVGVAYDFQSSRNCSQFIFFA